MEIRAKKFVIWQNNIVLNQKEWFVNLVSKSISISLSMLVEDSTRREGYKCTCRRNAKEFKCKHSLGVAILRDMLVPPPEAKCQQLARLRRKGRKAAAPPAWIYLPFDIHNRIVISYWVWIKMLLLMISLTNIETSSTADTSLQVEGPACPAI